MHLVMYVATVLGAMLALLGWKFFSERGAQESFPVGSNNPGCRRKRTTFLALVLYFAVSFVPALSHIVAAAPQPPVKDLTPAGSITNETPAAPAAKPRSNQAASIVREVTSIVAEQFGLADEAVTVNASYVRDLGADELDLVELVMALEEEFEIEIPDKDWEKLQGGKVGDTIAYISQRLTKQ